MINVINVDTNLMNGSFLKVKEIIGCTIPDLHSKTIGMDQRTTVYVTSKSINSVVKSLDQIHLALSVHMVPHSYSIRHNRIQIA